ncbi:Hypothetical protein NTJ_04624 [Nesidiocoris tenuis]|uniref:Uncharacterized protein n=1 Tax=Nesidiocoris tenuis TaxID=355587 RepID=A0ABN7ALN2_9HEMI|nr:Hypothetical protein NTJ_04624 [Nesidiocoris tenuis]
MESADAAPLQPHVRDGPARPRADSHGLLTGHTVPSCPEHNGNDEGMKGGDNPQSMTNGRDVENLFNRRVGLGL